jgi:hypothetical protein
MKTRFEVRNQSFEADIHRIDKPEGEKFENWEVSVRDADGVIVKGNLKLADAAVALAKEKSSEEGGSVEEWVVRGSARSLAAEIVIRPLKPNFSFVVDHRWIA